MKISENFLHYIWKFSLYDADQLFTPAGDAIKVLSPGRHNRDAGPDFLNAKIQIAKQVWAGNVEIHLRASDWEKHGHHADKAYNNVILHLAAENDAPIRAENGRSITAAELKFDPRLLKTYQTYLKARHKPACRDDLHRVDEFTLSRWQEVLLIERFERKTENLARLLKYTGNHWEEAFYIFLASAFGAKVNAQAFELTAKSLPSVILAKHKSSLFQLEALLLGQSGILAQARSDDEYIEKLQKEYDFLRKKFKLKPVEAHLWKYLRIRPANFPDIRLAQLAVLIYKSVHLFSKILEAPDAQSLNKMFEIEISGYWDTRYRIGKPSPKRKKSFGKTARNGVIINTVIPTLFYYGLQKKRPEYQERAMDFLEQLAPENNRIIRIWKEAGQPVKNAAESQAILQLHNAYCTPKRCLECRIGNQLIAGKK